MLEVVRYTSDKKDEWDAFVKESDNSSFLFYRDYMEYHEDRFKDFSLLLYDKNKLCALLPGNILNDEFISHQGLTFGGIISSNNFGYNKANKYIEAFLRYMKSNHIYRITIKEQPFFYSNSLQQIQNFILESNKSVIKRYNIGAFIFLSSHSFPKKCVRKGKLEEYNCYISEDLPSYWSILEECLLSNYKTKPVHSLSEISLLKDRFPNNIKLFIAEYKQSKTIHSGALIYLHRNIVKLQYLATNQEGRKNRASDVLYYNLINNYKSSHQYIDFGTNMDSNGVVNDSLLETKEKFGAKEFPVRTYQINKY